MELTLLIATLTTNNYLLQNFGRTLHMKFFFSLGPALSAMVKGGPERVQPNNCMACFVQITVVLTLSLSKYFIGGTAEYKQSYTPVM